jgi:antitoxin FitA
MPPGPAGLLVPRHPLNRGATRWSPLATADAAAGPRLRPYYGMTANCFQCCYNAFMTALTIRDVSDDAVRTMKLRAAQNGQSLQAYVRGLIEREATKPTIAEAVEQARKTATADISTADILTAIDAGRASR